MTRGLAVMAWSLAVAIGGAAHAVQVSLPADAAIAAVGQTTAVAISIAPVTPADGLFAGSFNFTYDPGVATATGAAAAPLISGCSTSINLSVPGAAAVNFACTAVVVGSGALLNVMFEGVAVGVSPLVFAATAPIPNGCELNEGVPSCERQNGELVVGSAPPTATPTVTPPATSTSTQGPPATVTATGTATPVRPSHAIPVVASPFSAAGLLLVVGLAVALLAAVRRRRA